MRPALLALVGLALAAPAVSAATTHHVVYLHENPLHALPESINAHVGETLQITIENPAAEGKTPHNFLVCGDGTNPLEKCDDRWAFTGMIQPGENATATFEAKRAGTFDYYCFIPGHKSGGMSGTLVVQSEATQKSTVPLGPLALAALAGAAAVLARRNAP